FGRICLKTCALQRKRYMLPTCPEWECQVQDLVPVKGVEVRVLSSAPKGTPACPALGKVGCPFFFTFSLQRSSHFPPLAPHRNDTSGGGDRCGNGGRSRGPSRSRRQPGHRARAGCETVDLQAESLEHRDKEVRQRVVAFLAK